MSYSEKQFNDPKVKYEMKFTKEEEEARDYFWECINEGKPFHLDDYKKIKNDSNNKNLK
jgi:hypothetical protein